jgi:flagellar L-ring protein precursor FlgH
MKNLSNWVVSLALLALAGCVVSPSTTIKTPLTARPADRDALAPHNGAIFQAGKFEHPLFEDRHPRNVGDILTINIVETISATQSASNSAANAGSINASTPTITGGASAQKLLNPFGITDSSAGSLSNKSAYAGANTFTGTITVTVVDVLPNGNLIVGGEKQMAINQSNGYIRLSGVVDPTTITTTTTGYTVQSTQVADAHIDYKDADGLDTSQIMTTLGRAFRSLLPF